LQDFAGWLANGRIALPDVVAIPPAQCLPAGSAGADIGKDRDYFTVTINELFLSNARRGWATYDPMVLVTTSFLYGDKRISVPSVVGPGLLAQAGQRLPQGLVLQDTTVAGPYPYRGGPVAIALAFYRFRHQDYAQGLLQLVEGVSNAVGPAADMGILAKIGGPLLDGLNKLLGMGETEPIAGHRIELSPVRPGGFRTCFSALIDGDADLSVPRLRVDGGRLLTVTDGGGAPQRYGEADYVLYSVSGSNRRDDEAMLPIYALYQRALQDAARGGEDAWKSAKATFAELWQQMILSPDLTRPQAAELFDAWKKDLLGARERGEDTRMMSANERARLADDRLQGAASVLDL
jgi:hypothetical protein